MLGIIGGLGITMVGISARTSASIEEQITGLGSNLLFVQSALSASVGRRTTVRTSPRRGARLVYDDASPLPTRCRSGGSGGRAAVRRNRQVATSAWIR
jgi:hypothetical protein